MTLFGIEEEKLELKLDSTQERAFIDANKRIFFTTHILFFITLAGPIAWINWTVGVLIAIIAISVFLLYNNRKLSNPQYIRKIEVFSSDGSICTKKLKDAKLIEEDTILPEQIQGLWMDKLHHSFLKDSDVYSADEWSLYVQIIGREKPRLLFSRMVATKQLKPIAIENKYERWLASPFVSLIERRRNARLSRLQGEIEAFEEDVNRFITNLLEILYKFNPAVQYNVNTDMFSAFHKDVKKDMWNSVKEHIRTTKVGSIFLIFAVLFNFLADVGPIADWLEGTFYSYDYPTIMFWFAILMSAGYLCIFAAFSRHYYKQLYKTLDGIDWSKQLRNTINDIDYEFDYSAKYMRISQTFLQERGKKHPGIVRLFPIVWFAVIAFVSYSSFHIFVFNTDIEIGLLVLGIDLFFIYMWFLFFKPMYKDTSVHEIIIDGNAFLIKDVKRTGSKIHYKEGFSFNDVYSVLLYHRFSNRLISGERRYGFYWNVFLSTTKYDDPYVILPRSVIIRGGDVREADGIIGKMEDIFNKIETLFAAIRPDTLVEYKEEQDGVPTVSIATIANTTSLWYPLSLLIIFLAGLVAFIGIGPLLYSIITMQFDGFSPGLIGMVIVGFVLLGIFTPIHKREKRLRYY